MNLKYFNEAVRSSCQVTVLPARRLVHESLDPRIHQSEHNQCHAIWNISVLLCLSFFRSQQGLNGRRWSLNTLRLVRPQPQKHCDGGDTRESATQRVHRLSSQEERNDASITRGPTEFLCQKNEQKPKVLPKQEPLPLLTSGNQA